MPTTKQTKDGAPAACHEIFSDVRLPWALDMDGTLIYEDVTEVAFEKCLHNPLLWPVLVWSLILWVFHKETGYRFVETFVPINPKTELSYNRALQSLLTSHRKRGGKAVLATASHVSVGKKVVDEGEMEGLFDDVWGSCMAGERNVYHMAAENKASVLDRFLTPSARFTKKDKKGFVYAGNSHDDIKVWSHPSCKGMILVNCDEKVLLEAQKIPKPFLVVPAARLQ